MKIIHTGDPGVLELRSRSVGCVILAGLGFLFGGGLAVAVALGRARDGLLMQPELKMIAIGAGAVGILLGLVFIGGISGMTIDGRARLLTLWSGLFIPLHRKSRRLEDLSQVVLAKKIRRGKNSSTPLYVVQIEGHGSEEVQVNVATDYPEARRLAEAVARVLHMSMVDSTSGVAVVRRPEHLDETVRQRVRRLGRRVEVPARPHDMRSRATILASEVEIEVPGMSSAARLTVSLVVVVIGLGFGVFLFGALVFTGEGGHWDKGLLELLPPLFFVVVPLTVVLVKIRSFNRPVSVTVSREALTVTEGGSTTEILCGQLEELSLAGKAIDELFRAQPDGSIVIDPSRLDTLEGAAYVEEHGRPPRIPPALVGVVRTLGSLAPERLSILARSDRATVRFGAGLSSEELTYLYSAIMNIVAD